MSGVKKARISVTALAIGAPLIVAIWPRSPAQPLHSRSYFRKPYSRLMSKSTAYNESKANFSI